MLVVVCNYIGGEASELGHIEFDAVGQTANLSERGFREVILGGAAFLPKPLFKRVGFTEKELDEQGPLGLRHLPSESFCNKLIIAQQFYRELRAELESGVPVEEVLAALEGSEVVP